MITRRRAAIYTLLVISAVLAVFSRYVAESADQMKDQVTTASPDQKAIYAALATSGLMLGLLLNLSLFRRLERVLNRRHDSIQHALRIQRLEVIPADQARQVLLGGLHLARSGVALTMIALFVARTLIIFPEAVPLAQEIELLLRAPLEKAWQAIYNYLPNLFDIAIILIITRYALKLVHLFFHAISSGIIVVRGFYPDWAEPTYKIVRILALVFVSFILVPLLPGAGSEFFEEISFFVGLLVSLGSTSAIKNMTAGAVLTYTRSFQVGDRLQIGETTGDVLEKSLFVTHLRTIKNERVTIPNGNVLDSDIVNYSAMAQDRGLVLHTSVTIGYDVDWREVHDLLIGAALQTEHIQQEPKPFVLQTSLDDYYVAYQINAYTAQAGKMAEIYSDLHRNILDAFHSAGVEIMSPAYTALRNGNDPAMPAARVSGALPQHTPPPPRSPNGYRVHLPQDERSGVEIG